MWSNNMGTIVIKILQGSVVTYTMLGGLTMHHSDANCLWCMTLCSKNYENWLRVDRVIAMKTVCSFFGSPCIHSGNFKTMSYGSLVKPANLLTYWTQRVCSTVIFVSIHVNPVIPVHQKSRTIALSGEWNQKIITTCLCLRNGMLQLASSQSCLFVEITQKQKQLKQFYFWNCLGLYQAH